MAGNTLSGIGYAAPGYQVGLGPSYAQSFPYDLYTALGGTAAGTLSPLTSLIVLEGSSTITSATIQFPSNPVEGQSLTITGNAAVTTLTLTAGTQSANANATDTIVGGVSALSANTPVTYAYRVAPALNTGTTNLYTWYRVQ